MDEFSSLAKQDARDYWTHEEYEFTPWLAEQITTDGASELEDTLGLDLEVIEQEKRVGKYSVDIYARVIDDGRGVVIENQLGDSDHDHLGKAIAYAAGLDADIIIWIAPQFNDEHRDAVQWLNENSQEGVDLFAIQLEVWKIEDSPPAVRLNPVEKPSEWKQKSQRTRGQLSERNERREAFWTEFRDCIEQTSTPVRARKPQPRHYYSNPIGVSGYHISFYVDEDAGEIGLQLTIEDSKEAFHRLEQQADEIEAELGTDVYWGELRETRSGNMRSELKVKRAGEIENQAEWDEYFDWMLEMGERFHEVFPHRLRNVG